jgi:hypothetical protein
MRLGNVARNCHELVAASQEIGMNDVRSIVIFGGMVFSMLAFTANSASATTLEVNGVTQNNSLSLLLTEKSGTTEIIKDDGGFSETTCTGTEMEAKTESPYTASAVQAKVSKLAFTGCTHSVAVIKPGRIRIIWTSGTTNASMLWLDFEWAVVSTIFGVKCNVKSESAVAAGTLTGVSSGNAIWDLNMGLNMGVCGNGSLTGTWAMTKPSGLGVEG